MGARAAAGAVVREQLLRRPRQFAVAAERGLAQGHRGCVQQPVGEGVRQEFQRLLRRCAGGELLLRLRQRFGTGRVSVREGWHLAGYLEGVSEGARGRPARPRVTDGRMLISV